MPRPGVSSNINGSVTQISVEAPLKGASSSLAAASTFKGSSSTVTAVDPLPGTSSKKSGASFNQVLAVVEKFAPKGVQKAIGSVKSAIHTVGLIRSTDLLSLSMGIFDRIQGANVQLGGRGYIRGGQTKITNPDPL